MEPFAFCPACGRKLESDAAFCPGCGRPLKAQVAAKPKPKAGPLWPWLLAVAVIVIPIIFMSVNYALSASCPDAVTAVLAYHRTLFGLLNTYVAPLSESCSTGFLETPVSVSWTVGATTHTATYLVWASGSISPGNATAVKIDQIAAQGPSLALSALRFLP